MVYSCFPFLHALVVAAELLQSCPTLSDLVDCSPPGSSVHGIFQARVLEWGAIAFSSLLSRPWFFSNVTRELGTDQSEPD